MKLELLQLQVQEPKRSERIVAYTEAMVRCYHQILTAEERAGLHAWEASPAFTSTDEWPGWSRHIGLSPVLADRRPELLRRRA